MSPVCSISLAAFLAWCSSAHAGDIEGSAKPVDGDSFNTEVRIFGIDAPEPGQTCKNAQGLSYPCGRIASDAMAELLRGKTVRCENGTKTPRTGGPSPSATPTAWMLGPPWSTEVSPSLIVTTPSNTFLTRSGPRPRAVGHGLARSRHRPIGRAARRPLPSCRGHNGERCEDRKYEGPKRTSGLSVIFVLPIALLRWLQTQIGPVFGLGFYVLTGRTQGSCFTRGAI
jgi:hypothetical protein